MNRENIIYRHYLFIALLLLLSCSPQKKDWSEMTSKEIIKTVINTQIYIPEDLLIYENDELVAFDSISLSESKFKIITLIYGDCEKCIKNINSWHDLENEIMLIGTPFYNDKSMQLYKNTIENFK